MQCRDLLGVHDLVALRIGVAADHPGLEEVEGRQIAGRGASDDPVEVVRVPLGQDERRCRAGKGDRRRHHCDGEEEGAAVCTTPFQRPHHPFPAERI
jgi:hypothetical protein